MTSVPASPRAFGGRCELRPSDAGDCRPGGRRRRRRGRGFDPPRAAGVAHDAGRRGRRQGGGECDGLRPRRALLGPVAIDSVPVEQVQGGDICIITASVKPAPGDTRLDLLAGNVAVLSKLAAQLEKNGLPRIAVVISNPVDMMTELLRRRWAGRGVAVLGTGTVLDTMRLRHRVAESLDVSGESVHAWVVGEHGDSSVLLLDSARVGGLSLDEFCRRTRHRHHEALVAHQRPDHPSSDPAAVGTGSRGRRWNERSAAPAMTSVHRGSLRRREGWRSAGRAARDVGGGTGRIREEPGGASSRGERAWLALVQSTASRRRGAERRRRTSCSVQAWGERHRNGHPTAGSRRHRPCRRAERRLGESAQPRRQPIPIIVAQRDRVQGFEQFDPHPSRTYAPLAQR